MSKIVGFVSQVSHLVGKVYHGIFAFLSYKQNKNFDDILLQLDAI